MEDMKAGIAIDRLFKEKSAMFSYVSPEDHQLQAIRLVLQSR